jgi:beta-glucosidase
VSTESLAFPQGFEWGSATSAYQVEGGTTASQWAEFERTPGAIWHGDRSGRANDWWRSTDGDFDLMRDLGMTAHRFSVEWSRIEPTPGVFDSSAIDRYRAMLDGLLARGIEPMICLHHFSNPLWLWKQGSWERPEIVERFQAFVRYTVSALSDLCSRWLTINEPQVYVNHGYVEGIFPPRKQEIRAALRVYRHMALAHGVAYQTIHALQPHAQVGNASALRAFRPLRPKHLGDQAASALWRYLGEELWWQAVRNGRLVPPLGWGDFHPALRDSFDFIGINYYTRTLMRFTPDPQRLFGTRENPQGAELSDSGRDGPYSWFAPEGLYDLCMEMSALGKPIYITENGLPDADDDQRPRWLLAHLAAVQRAISNGADVRGYYHWTLVDNFEWAEGWGLRFGLVALDTATGARTPRPSAALFHELATRNAIERDAVARFAPELLPALFPPAAAQS